MSEEIKYSPAEEFLNASSHAVATLLSIYGLVMLVVASRNPVETASTSIFGAMLILLFQSSTLYHAMVNETAKKVFRKIDHSAIFMLIAGTYTPILLLIVPFPNSVALLAMTWYLSVMGIVFSCITVKFKYINTALYLVMGWLSVLLFQRLIALNQPEVIWYLVGGGLLYSLGCVFYLLKKIPFMHCVWHLFVVAGAAMHYFAIMALLSV